MGPSMDLTDPWNSDLSEVLFVRLGPSADLTDPWNSDFSEGVFVCHKDLFDVTSSVMAGWTKHLACSFSRSSFP